MPNPWLPYAFPQEGREDATVVGPDGLDIAQPLEGITFKAPQLLAYKYGLAAKRFILSFDKGMGKTVTYLTIMRDLVGDERLLILCSRNAMLAQRRELRRYFPDWADSFVFVEGQREQRAKKWQKDAKVFICTPASLQADMGLRKLAAGQVAKPAQAPKWVSHCAIVIDEYHKWLRSRKSGVFEMLKTFDQTSPLILSSGSASGKGAQDLWAALHIVARVNWRGYWPYVNKYCIQEDMYHGRMITGVKNIAQWRYDVAPFIFHRRKDIKDYPVKTRQALEVRMEPWQKKIHDSLRRELFAELGDSIILAPNSLAATMKIRQFMVCPRFFSPELGWGAGLEGILADIQDSELKHFVISTPFTGPIPLIEQFFAQAGYPTERLMGGDGIDADEMERRIARWTKNGGLMVQSIKYAESYELPAARVMYMLGADYDPEVNSQAEDRIHRDIRVTPHPVDIYYVKHLQSYDRFLMDRLSTNADNVHNLMNRPLSEVFSLLDEEDPFDAN